MMDIKQLSEDEVIMMLRLYIVEHFDTKRNFAKHLGISCTFVTFITSKNKLTQKPIPENILKMIGVKKQVIYTKG